MHIIYRHYPTPTESKTVSAALQVLLVPAKVGNYGLEAPPNTYQLTLEKGRHFFLTLILWVLIFLILTQ